jgi:sugar phosphate isomerase/epimerase
VEDGVRRLRNVLQAGRELRVLVVNTYTGDAETPEQRAAFVEQIRAISDEAEEAGIRLCLETDSNMLPTAAIGAKVLDEIGHPWLQMNYDPGNVVYFASERPEEDVRHALGRLGHVHLKDKRGGKGVLTSRRSARASSTSRRSSGTSRSPASPAR